jgi:hypothetical protein
MAKKKAKKSGSKRWMTAVMAEYRKNKKGGLKAAMKRAKKSYRR